jgi:hypothetical protein
MTTIYQKKKEKENNMLQEGLSEKKKKNLIRMNLPSGLWYCNLQRAWHE